MDTLDRRSLLVFNRLRPMYIFKSLADVQLVALARQLERETPGVHKPICLEGDPGEHFYIVDKGRVRLSSPTARRTITLEPGDFFGAEALLGPAGHPYTANALTGDVSLLRLSKDHFAELVEAHAYVRESLRMMGETRRLLNAREWEWLPHNEAVYLITQRHPFLLFQRQLLPGAVCAGLLILAGVVWALGGGWWSVIPLALAVGGVVWMYLVYVDWGNDYYIVTAQRVVYLEKVVLLYDSRLTLAMNAVSSVQSNTGNVADRFLEYGDLSVLTFSRPMAIRGVAFPQVVAAVVEEQMQRFKSRQKESEVNALKSAIRTRIGPAMDEPKQDLPLAAPPAISRTITTPPGASLSKRLREFFSVQLRFDQGDAIVYRKHWWILLQGIGAPSGLLVLDLVGIVVMLFGVPLPSPLNPPIMILVFLVLFIVLAGWWLYEFQDWRNDLYMVTPDQIVDVYRKPLGQETRDSSTLDKIQGLRSERTGLLGRLLNFGNVTANVPGKTFTFDDVYDPLNVQEDIQRRIEAYKNRQNRNEALRRREELADVLSAYFLATQDLEQKQTKYNTP